MKAVTLGTDRCVRLLSFMLTLAHLSSLRVIDVKAVSRVVGSLGSAAPTLLTRGFCCFCPALHAASAADAGAEDRRCAAAWQGSRQRRHPRRSVFTLRLLQKLRGKLHREAEGCTTVSRVSRATRDVRLQLLRAELLVNDFGSELQRNAAASPSFPFIT